MATPTGPDNDNIRADRANVLTQTRNQILNEGFKGLTLINSGGAGALAAFLQAIWDKPTAAPMRVWLLVGIGLLLLGTAISAVLFLARYLAFFHPDTATPTRNPWWWATIILVALSMACFLLGMAAAVISGLGTLLCK